MIGQKMLLIRFVVGICFVIFYVSPALAQQRNVPTNQSQIALSFSPVVKQVSPAVVNIYAKRVVAERVSPFFGHPFFGDMFGFSMQGLTRPRIQNSLGSGVIIRESGLVVTNAHVAEGAEDITVVLQDRREVEAEVVMVDDRSDLALLQIKNDDQGRFPSVTLGDSRRIEVGDLVLALGNPFGVGQTVTSGIISAVARTAILDGGQRGARSRDRGETGRGGYFIQTDAAVNPGNSGGALVAMSGEVIGINTLIYSKSGASHGIGFATPSNLVKAMVRAYDKGEALTRPWLGAKTQSVTADMAEALDLDVPSGVLIAEVHAEGPAKEAGLKAGDVLLDLDGQALYDADALSYFLATLTMDQTVTLRYWRDGQINQTRLRVMTPPETPARDRRELAGAHPLQGVTVVNISPAVQEELGGDLPDEGVVVEDISARSPARRLGLQVGDVLESINGSYIKTTQSLEEILANKNAPRGWRIVFRRGAQSITAVLQ